jgi:AraC-like DNA-binding protein
VLIANSSVSVGASTLRMCVILERSFRGSIISRDRMVHDSRYAVGAINDDWAVLYVTVRGWFETGERRDEAPVCYLMDSGEFEQPGVAAGFRSWGAPAVVVELVVPVSALSTTRVGLAWGPVQLGASAWAAVAALTQSFESGAPVDRAMLELVSVLAEEGIVTHDLAASVLLEEEPAIARVWGAIARRLSTFATSTSLQELADLAGVSIAQAGRDIKQLLVRFPYLGSKFRELAWMMRLRLALQLLTAPDVTVTEVASVIGYGSLAAMDRAFRDAGLPPPSTIARELSYDAVAR